MKLFLTAAIFLCTLENISAQSNVWMYDFENWYSPEPLIFETASDPNNIWQIGPPQKTVLNTAFSVPNVLITDTLSPYPAGDTSIFYVLHQHPAGANPLAIFSVFGHYWVNTDSLSDFATIDISPNNGATWINVFTDPVFAPLIAADSDMPVLTGNSGGWKYFFINMLPVSDSMPPNNGDIIIYRFTFISDSVQTNKDGLMFDDLGFYAFTEGIENLNDDFQISVYPNPVSDVLQISFDDFFLNGKIFLLNAEGCILLQKDVSTTSVVLHAGDLPDGMYCVLFTSGEAAVRKKVMVLH